MKNILIGRYNKQNNNKNFIKATKERLLVLLDEDKQIFPLLKKNCNKMVVCRYNWQIT